MKWVSIISLAFVAVAACCLARAECAAVDRSYNGFEINSPGAYCLDHPYTEPRRFVISEGGEKGGNGPLAHISASDVDVNLRGFRLSAEAIGVSGIESGRSSGIITRIFLHNGTIKSRTSWGVRFIDAVRWDLDRSKEDFFELSARLPLVKPVEEKEYGEFLVGRQRLREAFPSTAHRLDNLAIESSATSINIRGGDNRVSNCNVRTLAYATAISLSGPGQVIENNTITVHLAPSRQHEAPIKLVMANNSIIRNNTIIIEGGDDSQPAISLIDSKNVVIENNKIIGTKVLYKIWDELPGQRSNVIERGNQFLPAWEKYVPERFR